MEERTLSMVGVDNNDNNNDDALDYQLQLIMQKITIIMMIQFIRRHNMSMKSLQGHRTPGSRNECRTAPDGCQRWTKPTNLSHWPACRQL